MCVLQDWLWNVTTVKMRGRIDIAMSLARQGVALSSRTPALPMSSGEVCILMYTVNMASTCVQKRFPLFCTSL